jgi:hypothetical protein
MYQQLLDPSDDYDQGGIVLPIPSSLDVGAADYQLILVLAHLHLRTRIIMAVFAWLCRIV